MIGRWGPEEFAAILIAKKSEAMASAKWITEHLSGAYACLKGGKTVRPAVQLTVGVVDTAANEQPERIIERIGPSWSAKADVPVVSQASGAERHLLHLVPALLQDAHHAVRAHHVGRAHHYERGLLPLEELFRHIRHVQVAVLQHRLGKFDGVGRLFLDDLLHLGGIAADPGLLNPFDVLLRDPGSPEPPRISPASPR